MSKLKSIAIAFELPIFDEHSIDLATLNKDIFNEFLYYIDIIKEEFNILTLDNGNKCLLFDLVTRYNKALISYDDREAEYDKMKTNIQNLIESELKSKSLMYKVM